MNETGYRTFAGPRLLLELRLPTSFVTLTVNGGIRMKHPKERHIYVGIDLHKHKHVAVIINHWHEKLGKVDVENKPSAFDGFIQQINQYKKRGITPIFGLEDWGGYGRALAVYLVEHNYTVKDVNPSFSASERKNQPMTMKHDEWDAECVAHVLLNKLDLLPNANPQDVYWTIKQLVNRRSALVKEGAKLKQQLHIQLSHNYPSYKEFFSEIDSKTSLAFWEKYSSPDLLFQSTILPATKEGSPDTSPAAELLSLLREASNNVFTLSKAEKIIEYVKADGVTKRDYQEQRNFLIQSVVRDIRFKQEEIRRVEEQMRVMMNLVEYKLETMPGISLVTAASLVAEIGDIRRFANADKLAKLAGIAPMPYGSGENGGKGDKYKKTRQGNRVLHELFYQLAVQQVQHSKSKKQRNPYLYAYHKRKLNEGKTKGQAMVSVMRRLVNTIYGMMKTKTAYVQPVLNQTEAS
jgi:transposase